MPANINSASRLYSIFSQLTGHADNVQVLAGWVITFSIAESTPKRQALEVARRLDAMARELELVRFWMSKANYSTNLYESTIASLEEATSPMILPHTWNTVRQYITPQNRIALQFCGEILPSEENLIGKAELDEIFNLIQDLRSAAASEGIPGGLRALIIHHIELIERALNEYPISGSKALREAAQTGLGELIEAKELVEENKQAPEVAKLARAWKKVGEVADLAIKADKLVQVGHKAWEHPSPVPASGVREETMVLPLRYKVNGSAVMTDPALV
jgi:hypothetical protein